MTICVAVVVAWLMYINGLFLPGWIDWKEKVQSYENTFEINLAHREVAVTDKSKSNENIISDGVPASEEVWHSSSNMKVQDYLIADITGDGNDELVLLFWRRGRFGMYRPFFIEKNDKRWSQHIAVYRYDEDKMTFDSIWTASDIGVLVSDWKYDDMHRRLIIADSREECTVWMWSGFGFSLVDSEVSFAVAGDNLIHDNIYSYGMEKRAGDFSFLYKNIRDRLSKSDVRVLNLETILVDREDMYSGYPAFGTPLEVGMAAADAGFNVFTCATNHALDKGMYGIDTTVTFCGENNITCVGIQSSDEEERKAYDLYWKKGYCFAFFNYTMGLSNTDGEYPKDVPANAVHMLGEAMKEQIASDIREAKAATDGVIVFVHWGTEDSAGVDSFQREWAELMAESGADVIVGTHPHVLQPVEKIVGNNGEETVVYYSIGNLVSSQRGEDNRLGGIAEFSFKMTLDGMYMSEHSLRPVVTHHGEEEITCYYLDDYTDEIASQKKQNLSVEDARDRFSHINVD